MNCSSVKTFNHPLATTLMETYRSIVYREIIEINGSQHILLECDYTHSINEAIEYGGISHPSNSLSEYEVINYVKDDITNGG